MRTFTLIPHEKFETADIVCDRLLISVNGDQLSLVVNEQAVVVTTSLKLQVGECCVEVVPETVPITPIGQSVYQQYWQEQELQAKATRLESPARERTPDTDPLGFLYQGRSMQQIQANRSHEQWSGQAESPVVTLNHGYIELSPQAGTGGSDELG
jgi:hypothetical protein